MNELEIVQYPHVSGLRLFLNTVYYRTAHLHSEWELVWVLENTLSVNCGQKHYLVEPGQMILFNPNEPHEFQRTQVGCTFACMQVSSQILPLKSNLYVNECLVDKFLPQEQMNSLRKQFLDVLHMYLRQEQQYALYCVAQSCMMFYQLLSFMPNCELTAAQATNMDKRSAILKRLVRFVDDHYTGKIKLSDFAETEGYSVGYLSHYIKNGMNQTFQEYVTSVRLNSARNMIAAGGKRLLDICMEAGFSDYRYFCKAFRMRYNMTPEEYKRNGCGGQSLAKLRPSIHSEERIYSIEESLEILNRLSK